MVLCTPGFQTIPCGGRKSMRCPACGAAIEQDDKFCYACGAPTKSATEAAGTDPQRCPACGGAIGDGDAFCGNCGAALGDAPEELQADAVVRTGKERPAAPPDPSSHPVATLFGYAYTGIGLLGVLFVGSVVAGAEPVATDLPEALLYPVVWFLQPLGWAVGIILGAYLWSRKNVTARLHGKIIFGLSILLIIAALFTISVLAFADIGID
jgi:predicted nucleic acid-binding Zn ribbon protein